MEGRSEAAINQLKEAQAKSKKDIRVVDEVNPDMPDITIKRQCMKFGNWLSWIERPRFFNFDASTEKYRYYRPNEDKDVEHKATHLALCQYAIENRV